MEQDLVNNSVEPCSVITPVCRTDISITFMGLFVLICLSIKSDGGGGSKIGSIWNTV